MDGDGKDDYSDDFGGGDIVGIIIMDITVTAECREKEKQW